MTEHKRSPCSVEQSSLSSLASKRHKADLSAKVSSATSPFFFFYLTPILVLLEYGFLVDDKHSLR